jgi:cytidylate kinase
MIIAISGFHGTGKSTIAKLLAEKFGLKYHSTGELFREFAKKRNLSLEDFSKYVENHPEIDRELDEKIIEKAKEGNIIIDSQLSGHILNSIADFKIHLKCSLESRVKRMTDRDETSFQKKLKETLLRESSELKRYKELYNIDLSDINTIYAIHDLVIDTENLSVDEVLDKIISKLREAKNKKP